MFVLDHQVGENDEWNLLGFHSSVQYFVRNIHRQFMEIELKYLTRQRIQVRHLVEIF